MPSPRPAIDAEITWLLHRAARRMRAATGETAKNRRRRGPGSCL
jgi:hypothetical protein